MSEDLIQRQPSTAEIEATRFDQMADRIRLNADQAFGGAFVIAPPRNGGEAIETLILDTNQDPTQYWVLLKSKCDLEIDRLRDQSKSQQAFGRR
jgi:hypothetical protein